VGNRWEMMERFRIGVNSTELLRHAFEGRSLLKIRQMQEPLEILGKRKRAREVEVPSIHALFNADANADRLVG